MNKLRTIILLAELDDGIVYRVILSKRQSSAVKSVLAALPEPLNLQETPLSEFHLAQETKQRKRE